MARDAEPSVLTPRPLESVLFGIAVAVAFPDSPQAVDSVADEVALHPNSLAVVRVPSTASAAIQRLEARGGRLCDALLTLTSSAVTVVPSASNSGSAADLLVRQAAPEDATALDALSHATFRGFQSHWHQDGRLAPDLADLLYVRWSIDLLRTATDRHPLLVAVSAADGIVGFLAVNAGDDGRWHVPLTGVHPNARGRRVLPALLQAAVHHVASKGGAALEYETQLTNLPALRAVVRCGFVPTSSRMTFHLWGTDS